MSIENKTNVKNDDTRREEVLAALGTEIARFFEEKLEFYLTEAHPHLLKEILKYAITHEKFDDLLDQFYRDIQKETSFESTTEAAKLPIIAHPSTHWLVKELVLADTQLTFAKTILEILSKKLKTHLVERSSFIVLAYLENERLWKLVPEDWINVKDLKKLVSQHP